MYRARDSSWARCRAESPAAVFAADGERLERFEREAKVLASLNHPNIAAIYGLEDSGVHALVLELVEGPTLADRIAQGRCRSKKPSHCEANFRRAGIRARARDCSSRSETGQREMTHEDR